MEKSGIIYRLLALWRRTARYPNGRAAAFAGAAPIALGFFLAGIEAAHILMFGHTFSESVAVAAMCVFGAVATLAWFIAFPILCWLAYCNDPRESDDQPRSDI